jgi:hypothetical protein
MIELVRPASLIYRLSKSGGEEGEEGEIWLMTGKGFIVAEKEGLKWL